MKDRINKVTEAKKAAEANLIARREETAAMRSQANTAKLLQDNPTLVRLRELEVLEKVRRSATLNIVLGEKGLAAPPLHHLLRATHSLGRGPPGLMPVGWGRFSVMIFQVAPLSRIAPKSRGW